MALSATEGLSPRCLRQMHGPRVNIHRGQSIFEGVGQQAVGTDDEKSDGDKPYTLASELLQQCRQYARMAPDEHILHACWVPRLNQILIFRVWWVDGQLPRCRKLEHNL